MELFTCSSDTVQQTPASLVPTTLISFETTEVQMSEESHPDCSTLNGSDTNTIFFHVIFMNMICSVIKKDQGKTKLSVHSPPLHFGQMIHEFGSFMHKSSPVFPHFSSPPVHVGYFCNVLFCLSCLQSCSLQWDHFLFPAVKILRSHVSEQSKSFSLFNDFFNDTCIFIF